MSERLCVESGVVCRNLSCATACMLRTERAAPPAPAQPASAEQQPVAWFSPEQKRAMAIIQSAAKALEEGTFTAPPALHEAARLALDALALARPIMDDELAVNAAIDALRAAIRGGK